ncbi:MAG: response regulator [Deltaproteobacteria bacterium]|nr:response regulator [Deltaproteobacteria bacterium]
MSMPRVLLVEDDPDTLTLFNALLSAEGLEVIRCVDGRSAREWWAAAQEAPDLLVVDVSLPDVNGLDLAREFTRGPRAWPMPPILVLSAHGDPRLPAKCRELGAAAFLDKLLDLDFFVDKVLELLPGAVK